MSAVSHAPIGISRGGAAVVAVLLAGLTFILFAEQVGFLQTQPAAMAQLSRVRLPPGFTIETWARGVRGARSLALGPPGVVFAGSRREGRVYALVERPGRAVEVIRVASGLEQPNGIAYHDGDLYVAEPTRILRYEGIGRSLRNPPRPRVVRDDLPDEPGHEWRYMRVGPDGKLYVAIGSPCNICEREDTRYGTILRMGLDGRGLFAYARGIRNSVGFDWDPRTHHLWFTDNGADFMGDDKPPDELNHALRPGVDFGFPRCHGTDIVDPEHGAHGGCTGTMPPAVELGAHVAALGMRFYDGHEFPARYRGGIFIAEHGSWNRSTPIGYRVVFVPFTDGAPGRPETFASGWLARSGVWGRPVDVLVAPDGALLVSDDEAGVVYRIRYAGT